jgi:hypothetical protein
MLPSVNRRQKESGVQAVLLLNFLISFLPSVDMTFPETPGSLPEETSQLDEIPHRFKK